MQIKSLRLKSYRSWKVDERIYSATTHKRYKELKTYRLLREEGCSEEAALKAIELSRATLFRWQKAYRNHGLASLEPKSTVPKTQPTPQWSKQLEQQVLHLRCQFPLWGKRTLTTLLHRERGLKTSESTVGRILKKLIQEGKIKPVSFYYGRVKQKRSRIFNKHAKRWKKGMKAHKPGELIQIDVFDDTRLSDLAVRTGDELLVPEKRWLERNLGPVVTGFTATAALIFTILSR